MHDKNLLEYRPSLNPKKNIMSTLEKETPNIAKALFSPSPSLEQLKDNLPSVAIGKLDQATQAVSATLDRITAGIKDMTSNGITFSQYKEAVDANDLETVDAFEDPIASDINGNFMAELYYPIKKIADDLAAFTSFFKLMNYGQELDMKDAVKIDQTNYNKLYEKEMAGDNSSINYGSLYIDIQINQIVQLHAQNIMDSMKIVNDSIDAHENFSPELTSDTPSMAITATLEKVFEEDVDITAKDKVKLRQNLNSNTKADVVSKIFDKRRDFLTTMESVQTIADMGDSALKTKMVKSLNLLYNSVSDTILDMYKSMQVEAMYMQDYISTVGEKQNTRNSYRAYNK
jgi:hypothetical protein